MSLTNEQITAKNFKEFYEKIRPYLNGSFPTPIANKFDKANLYSTDEQIVGRWIDGKPLYQRTLVSNTQINDGNSDMLFADQLVGIDYIQKACPVMFQTNNNELESEYSLSATDNILAICSKVSSSNVGRLYVAPRLRTIYKTIATFQYTKTTDTAMEIGSDTDYSTTEKIVGTWIDGQPLYQKVVTGLTLTNAHSVSFGLSDMKEQVFCKLIKAKRSDNDWYRSTYYAGPNDFLTILPGERDSVYVVIGGNSTYTDASFVIQYTKTAD